MDYKKEIMKSLIDTPTIVSAIDATKIDTPDELIWENIFPIRRIPNINDKKRTFICVDLFVPSINGNMYKEVALVFSIFTHEDLQRTTEGYAVTDYLQSEVDKVFNGSDQYGLGYLELQSCKPLNISDKYLGSTLVYTVTNFNHGKCNA